MIEDELLGVVASDYFFGDMSSILQSIMSEACEASDAIFDDIRDGSPGCK